MLTRVENDEKLQDEEIIQGKVGYERGWSFSTGTDRDSTENTLDARPYTHTFIHIWSLSS